jgi:hypothetical protein
MLCNHRVTFDVDHASAGGSLVWIDGRPSSLSAANPSLALGGCQLIELSPETYEAIWNTGEILYVTDAGTYLNISSSLSWIDGLGSMEGLLSSDVNPDAWRLTDATLLLDPPTAVFEPGTLALLSIGIGLGCSAIERQRRRSRRASERARCTRSRLLRRRAGRADDHSEKAPPKTRGFPIEHNRSIRARRQFCPHNHPESGECRLIPPARWFF